MRKVKLRLSLNVKCSTVTSKVCITAIGMATSLGLDAVSSCAAARAGITRTSELNVLNFLSDQIWGGKSVVGHTVNGVADGFLGTAKAFILGKYGLQDLLVRRQFTKQELERTGIYINLSNQFLVDAHSIALHEGELELRKQYVDQELDAEDSQYLGLGQDEDDTQEWVLPSHKWREEAGNLIPKLLESCNICIPSSNQYLCFGNHAEIVNLLQNAIASMQSEKLDRCIIGGIDSCVQPDFLISTATQGILKTSVNPVGVIPGEASAFFLVERLKDAQSHGVHIACLISNGSTCEEKEWNRLSEDLPKGIGLSQVIEVLSSNFADPLQEIGLIIADLNGDIYRAVDWGCALTRLQNRYRIDRLPVWSPADAFGEVGAATGSVAICMGGRALQRRYAPSGSILVWLSSDNGSKAAICLEPLAMI